MMATAEIHRPQMLLAMQTWKTTMAEAIAQLLQVPEWSLNTTGLIRKITWVISHAQEATMVHPRQAQGKANS